ncbi:MAG: hypothetical protein ABSH46_17630 [Bryobacteraceae bacterium]
MSTSVACDESGIVQCNQLRDREVRERLLWSEVATVYAYKVDCFAVDQIRVALSDSTGRVRVLVCEDYAGYEELIRALPRYLPGCLAPEEWFQRVAFPAFETKWTALYRRSADS